MKIPHPFLRSDLKFTTLQKEHWDNSSRSFLTVATREKGQLPQYFMQLGLCEGTASFSSACVISAPDPMLPSLSCGSDRTTFLCVTIHRHL